MFDLRWPYHLFFALLCLVVPRLGGGRPFCLSSYCLSAGLGSGADEVRPKTLVVTYGSFLFPFVVLRWLT